MIPFDVGGGLVLAAVRGAWLVALLSGFGTLVFWVAVAPRALARADGAARVRVDRALLLVGWSSLGVAAVSLLVWLWLESAQMAGVASLGAVEEVAGGTVFGRVVLLQAAGLVATGLVLGRGRRAARRWGAAGLAAMTTAVQAGHGHAFAMAEGPSVLLGAGVLHLLAAGAWLGGLLPLLLVVWVVPARTAAAAARWFSPLGKLCVVVVALSAVVQFWVLTGGSMAGVRGSFGTGYGWVATLKLMLLAVLLGFAWVNRFRFAPRLLGAAPQQARAVLLWSVAVQTGFGVLVVLAASVLASLPPSTDGMRASRAPIAVEGYHR